MSALHFQHFLVSSAASSAAMGSQSLQYRSLSRSHCNGWRHERAAPHTHPQYRMNHLIRHLCVACYVAGHRSGQPGRNPQRGDSAPMRRARSRRSPHPSESPLYMYIFSMMRVRGAPHVRLELPKFYASSRPHLSSHAVYQIRAAGCQSGSREMGARGG